MRELSFDLTAYIDSSWENTCEGCGLGLPGLHFPPGLLEDQYNVKLAGKEQIVLYILSSTFVVFICCTPLFSLSMYIAERGGGKYS